MRSSSIFLAVTSAAVISANPQLLGLFDRNVCNADNCARAVTGTNAQPSSTARKSDCSSFVSDWPNGAVPTYASACSGTVRYSSACSCYGVTATGKSTASVSRSTTGSNITAVGSSTTSKNSTASSAASPTITSTLSSSGNSTKSLSTTTTTATACPHPSCLSDAQATAAVNTFIYLLANPTASNFISTANTLLCDNFTDTSDSINSLAGLSLGRATFSNKTAFIAGSGSQPPLILKTYDIFHSCRKIAWRWVTVKGAGSDADEVKGIDTFYTDGCGHICQIFAEFNSAAWLYNLGDPECSPTSMISFASTLTSTTASATVATSVQTPSTTATSA